MTLNGFTAFYRTVTCKLYNPHNMLLRANTYRKRVFKSAEFFTQTFREILRSKHMLLNTRGNEQYIIKAIIKDV